MSSFRVAAVQMASGPNLNANLMEAEALIKQAAQGGAQLVVLPETFSLMAQKESDKLNIAEPFGTGPVQQFLAAQAKNHQIWLIGGTTPIVSATPDKASATTLIFNPQGDCVGRYDKIHLFDAKVCSADQTASYCESAHTAAGHQIVVIETPFGRMGVAICYDLRFAELFVAMNQQGVDFLVIPSAFTATTGKAHWEILLRARAVESFCYVIAANQGGYHANGRETYGHSMVVDPWGKVIAERAKGNGVVFAEMDEGYQQSIRDNMPLQQHRRLEFQSVGVPRKP